MTGVQRGVTGVKGRVSLLFTVGAKQKIPFCSKCSSSKCLCFKTYKRLVNEAMEEENRMNLNEENKAHYRSLQEQLDSIIETEIQGVILRSLCEEYEKGEKCTM